MSPSEPKKKSVTQNKKAPVKKPVRRRVVIKRNLFPEFDSRHEVEVTIDCAAKKKPNLDDTVPSSKVRETAFRRTVKTQPTNQRERFFVKQSKSEDTVANKSNSSAQSKFKCPVCITTYCKKSLLRKHMKSCHSGVASKQFQCEVCYKPYVRKDDLKKHMRTHKGLPARVLNKKYKCKICGQRFHGPSLLVVHMRAHTGERPFACDKCPKTYPSSGSLSQHRLSHTGEKPFECSQCDQRFVAKTNLERHMHLHTGDKPFVCSYCNKGFIQLIGLKAHMFFHTGENGFKCEDCGKVFNQKVRLKMHILSVHEKSHQFSCDKCEKAFSRKENLNRHSVVHTGEKAFSCATCSKGFTTKSSLKHHLLTHREEEPVSCEECGHTYIRKDRLVFHMRRKHRHLCSSLREGNGDVDSDGAFEDLEKNVEQLLSLLVNENSLCQLGWLEKPVSQVLEALIKRCGYSPADPTKYSGSDQLRENAKLLFTSVIDDDTLNMLLKNQTVDEVILQVLHLAEPE